MRVFVTMLAVSAGSAVSRSDAELVRDTLWAHVGAVGEIEHITVAALPAGIGIAIFMNHLTERPEERARKLLRIAAFRSPLMSRWREAVESEAISHVSDDTSSAPEHDADRDPRSGCG